MCIKPVVITEEQAQSRSSHDFQEKSDAGEILFFPFSLQGILVFNHPDVAIVSVSFSCYMYRHCQVLLSIKVDQDHQDIGAPRQHGKALKCPVWT